MKISNKIVVIVLWSLFTVSCESEVHTENIIANEVEEVYSEEESSDVVTEVLDSELIIENNLSFLSTESTIEDCYFLDMFTENDTVYITVDLVEYEEVFFEGDSEPGYELVNKVEDKTTFVSPFESYYKCAHEDKKMLSELFKIAQDDPSTVFRLETKDGALTEFYIDICSG